MYETGMDEIQIHRKKRPKYLIKQQLYSNLGWSFEVITTTAHSCSVLNLNHPLGHETSKLSNTNGLNFSNVKHDKNTFICMTNDIHLHTH